jgi:hypothetical protein
VHNRAVFQAPAGGASQEKHSIARTRIKLLRLALNALIRPRMSYPQSAQAIHLFSAPVSRDESARYIRVFDENGKALDGDQAMFLPEDEH